MDRCGQRCDAAACAGRTRARTAASCATSSNVYWRPTQRRDRLRRFCSQPNRMWCVVWPCACHLSIAPARWPLLSRVNVTTTPSPLPLPLPTILLHHTHAPPAATTTTTTTTTTATPCRRQCAILPVLTHHTLCLFDVLPLLFNMLFLSHRW